MSHKKNNKKKIQLAVLAALTVVLGFSAFASFQSEDLEGASRGRGRNIRSMRGTRAPSIRPTTVAQPSAAIATPSAAIAQPTASVAQPSSMAPAMNVATPTASVAQPSSMAPAMNVATQNSGTRNNIPTSSIRNDGPKTQSSSTNDGMSIAQAPASISATFQSHGYDHPINLAQQTRLIHSACSYYSEFGKWKLTVNGAPLTLTSIPFLLETFTGTTDAQRHVADNFKMTISTHELGFNPIHTFSHTTTDNRFNLPTTSGKGNQNGITLQPGVYYISLDGQYVSSTGWTQSNNSMYKNGVAAIIGGSQVNPTIGQFKQNGQSYTADIGGSVQVNGGSNGFQLITGYSAMADWSQLCNQNVAPGSGGGVGKVIMSPMHPQPYNSQTDIIHVSDACPVAQDWEILGQWKMETRYNHLNLEKTKFVITHPGNNELSSEYRVTVSTTSPNHRNSMVGDVITSSVSQIQVTNPSSANGNMIAADEIIAQFNQPLELAYDWESTSGYVGAPFSYYLTIEGKPTQRTEGEGIYRPKARISDDANFVWGTFGEGLYWEQDAKISNENIIETGFNINSTESWIAATRHVEQTDALHPDPACFASYGPSYATVDLDATTNIKDVHIEGCTSNTSWTAIYQGAIETGPYNLDLDGIPFRIMGSPNGSLLSDAASELKVIVSSTPDYANSQVYTNNYPAPATHGSKFLLQTPGLSVSGDTTQYFTVLIKPTFSSDVQSGSEYQVHSTQVNAANAGSMNIIGQLNLDGTTVNASIDDGNVTLNPPYQPHIGTNAGHYHVDACTN